VRRSVGALLGAATKRQIGVVVFILVCGLMLLVDWTVGEPHTPATGSSPTAASHAVGAADRGAEPDPVSEAERIAAEKRAVPDGAHGTGVDVPKPAQPVAAAGRHPVSSLLSGPTFVRFVGFSMLSMGIAFGVLFVFWRQARNSP